MAYWVEVHCDTPIEDRPTRYLGDIVCRSNQNDNPACLAETAPTAARVATANARRSGWKRTRKYGWQCPVCQKHRTEFSDDPDR